LVKLGDVQVKVFKILHKIMKNKAPGIMTLIAMKSHHNIMAPSEPSHLLLMITMECFNFSINSQ
jgi:hypothetical protein